MSAALPKPRKMLRIPAEKTIALKALGCGLLAGDDDAPLRHWDYCSCTPEWISRSKERADLHLRYLQNCPSAPAIFLREFARRSTHRGIGKEASATGAVAMLQHKSENFWRLTAANPDGAISLAVVIIADKSACTLPGLLDLLQAGLHRVGPTSRTSDTRRGQGPDPARAQPRTRFAERKIGSRFRSAKRCNGS